MTKPTTYQVSDAGEIHIPKTGGLSEQELSDIIKQAWCDGDNNPEDKFGDFLNRAVKRIEEASWKSPEEVMEMFEGFEKTVKLLREQLAHSRDGYVKLAEDQTTLPEPNMDNYTAILMFKAGWRKVKL